MQTCPCQSQQPYENCCQPYHEQSKQPKTAEQLMRSRYAAYVLQQIDYIIKTTVPAQQALLDKTSITQWSYNAQWHSSASCASGVYRVFYGTWKNATT